MNVDRCDEGAPAILPAAAQPFAPGPAGTPATGTGEVSHPSLSPKNKISSAENIFFAAHALRLSYEARCRHQERGDDA